MRLARASVASTADAATSRPRVARSGTGTTLDYDGLPRIPGGPRFWRELERVVTDKILVGLDVDEFSSLGAERDAEKATKQLRIAIKLAVENLQYEARNIRRRARSGAGVFSAPPPKRTKDEIDVAYSTLSLDRETATSADARRAYHRLARHFHPDLNEHGGDHFTTARDAYKIVCDDLGRRGR